MLSFGKKIAKISPADPEIIVLRVIIKRDKKRKKLTQAKYIARLASLPSGLNSQEIIFLNLKFNTTVYYCNVQC